jgi:hypothetical protein
VIYTSIYHISQNGELGVSSKRIIITLPAEDKHWLEGYSRAQKISLAESIRKGVQKLKKANGLKTYERLVESTYGLWKKGDGLAYQMKIRSEWRKK